MITVIMESTLRQTDTLSPTAVNLLDIDGEDSIIGQPASASASGNPEFMISEQLNLNKKITSFHTADDPFKSLYRTGVNQQTIQSELLSPTSEDPSSQAANSDPAASDDVLKSPDDQQLTCINGKFQNLTLQRVLALRKVQASIESAPNASAVGATSTTFAEEDLKCLTMEELQALQRRKKAVVKESQPLSVVKVSIQVERTRKRLEPRDYQIELYERARRENTIAVLGTGTGKTLIACLLIKDILVQERANRVKGIKVRGSDEMGLMGRKRFVCLWFRLFTLCFNKGM